MKKKLLAVVLCLVMAVSVLAGCGSGDTAKDNSGAANESTRKVALITDVGTIDDESFNQATWQGVKEYCDANSVKYEYFQPTDDTNDARVEKITQAIAEGYDIIVLPGYLFGAAIYTVQDQYPNVTFVAVDVASGDLTLDYTTYADPAANTYCITFAEEQAGYLAGYAAVKDGYTQLGFLGGMAVPAVIRYGYGFIQGANAAAEEMGTKISIKYTYGGKFYGDASITAKMDGWYSNGTEIVFACGGGIYTSAVEAALNYDGKVIGVDTDQNYIGAKYDTNPFVTSAMKGLQSVTVSVLSDIFSGNFKGGQIVNYSLSTGEYLGLPTAESSWNFKTFTIDEYNTVKGKIADGSIVVDNSTDKAVTDFATDTTEIIEVK